MAEGFIVVRRGWRDNPIFKGEFSRGEAWLWLIENACWKPSRTRVKGETITLDRGEMSFSVRFLADAWGWSKSRVDRFLADLREESMIETRSKIGTPRDQKSGHIAGQGQSIIYICNYRKYQDLSANDRDNDRDNSGTTIGTTAGQQRDKEEPRNQGTKEEGRAARAKIDLLGEIPIDPAKAFFDEAIGYLGGKHRALIARWSRDFGIPHCVTALKLAKSENEGRGADDPIPFMTRVLANGAEREAARIEAERRADAAFDRRHPPRFISPDEAAKLFDRDKLAQWLAETPEGRMV